MHVEYPDAPLWFVFGAPGSKAQSRRSDLGKIVSQEGARVYLVPDDPAKEQVLDINAEIISISPRRRLSFPSTTGQQASATPSFLRRQAPSCSSSARAAKPPRRGRTVQSLTPAICPWQKQPSPSATKTACSVGVFL